ncbi:phytanoyl-CoA dioxygenase family protein [Pseudomonas akapageensis]|uniref:phytanoyl-CoA dioxygenase family protein n=1 Tax=Pseudomonas akapageensis TaxID=2609961 RepID=UPI00140C4252
MKAQNNPPTSVYGVLQQNEASSDIDETVEQILNIGYAVIDAGLSRSCLEALSLAFQNTRERYIQNFGADNLKQLGEYHTIRSLLTLGGTPFVNLALNTTLIKIIEKLIKGKFQLNQQNGLINPPKENYNQGSWHRDLPYQHFTSSSPLAINALFCMDDFTFSNGATYVLPASHKTENLPSSNYIQKNAIQIEAKAGSFIILDCMLFHAGGFNTTNIERRAINHVFTIPYFKQQINIPSNITEPENLTDKAKEILGFNYLVPNSIADYFKSRTTVKT